MTKVSRLLHPAKALSPILLTLPAIVTFFILEQPRKAPASILVTLNPSIVSVIANSASCLPLEVRPVICRYEPEEDDAPIVGDEMRMDLETE